MKYKYLHREQSILPMTSTPDILTTQTLNQRNKRPVQRKGEEGHAVQPGHGREGGREWGTVAKPVRGAASRPLPYCCASPCLYAVGCSSLGLRIEKLSTSLLDLPFYIYLFIVFIFPFLSLIAFYACLPVCLSPSPSLSPPYCFLLQKIGFKVNMIVSLSFLPQNLSSSMLALLVCICLSVFSLSSHLPFPHLQSCDLNTLVKLL